MTKPSTDALVLHERRGSVELITLNRPDRLNAWTDELEDGYFALLSAADADPDVRAIVVTGAGRGFCAGADMEMLQAIEPGAGTDQGEDRRRRHYPLTIGTPLVAAVNGAAAGLGLVEALYCDVRLTTPEAKWTTAFAQRGLVAEYGLAWLLPRLVGHGNASDLLLSGRVVTGEEAVRMGLANRVVESELLLDEAVTYAAGLAERCSPWSMAVMKDQLRRDAVDDFAAAEERSHTLMLASFDQPDVGEGVASYLEGRAPNFPPLREDWHER